jgi:hypothetical protein
MNIQTSMSIQTKARANYMLIWRICLNSFRRQYPIKFWRHVSRSRVKADKNIYYNLGVSEETDGQLVLHSAACPETNTSKFHHLTTVLKSLHWLNVTERINYKIRCIYILYDCLLSNISLLILRNLLTFPNTSATQSSSVIARKRLNNLSHLKISKISFFNSSPALRNNLYQKYFVSTTLIPSL